MQDADESVDRPLADTHGVRVQQAVEVFCGQYRYCRHFRSVDRFRVCHIAESPQRHPGQIRVRHGRRVDEGERRIRWAGADLKRVDEDG